MAAGAGAVSSDKKQTCGTRRGNGAGKPGSKGQGWGGAAKGASTSRIKPGDPDGIQAMSNNAAVKASAAERIAELTRNLEHLAFNAEREETRVSATVHALNRLEGMPVARQITAEASVERVLRIELVDEPGTDAAPHGAAPTAATRIQH